MNSNFNQQLSNWLQEVADECNRMGERMNLDFYAFQSDVYFRPEAMFIGANPGGEGKYGVRSAESLKYDRNMFLDNSWRSHSLCDLFSGDILHPVFEKAVITNVCYFNTADFKSLLQLDSKREALKFCVEKTVELIRDIVQPKRIILLGIDDKKGPVGALRKYLEMPLKKLLVTKEEGRNLDLIRYTTMFDIPVYIIHHPSRNQKFNSGENLALKKAKFEEIFKG
ncbi:uracil-DNA glycosylase family protein [Odoribacter lunatus]|uniref:uracil-DNA glycosylase family protein n=1 Tax=Odoribacter lunatus TaxID=2941335 RepID=UPI00203D25BD|nr:uracil-DNA glycosylase family protein [Odoribacter lunatus]